MKNRMPYKVPEGYFSGMEDRLSRIPEERGSWRRTFVPYLTVAVALAALAVAAFVFTGRQSDQDEDMLIYEQYVYADLIPHTDPFLEEVSGDTDYDYLTQQ